MKSLRDYTPARVGQGRTGHSLPTRELLEFQMAHAKARDAVHLSLDVNSLVMELKRECIVVASAAVDRTTYLRRPDLGRQLDDESRARLEECKSEYDVVFVIADGLSALAVHRHAAPLLAVLLAQIDWRLAPLVIATQARVALCDEIGEMLGAKLSVVLIGERPGLSSPDSLGVYLTWSPRPGRTEAERNCISNIRAEGLSYELAAHKLLFLMHESRRLKLSGVNLKESALPLASAYSDARSSLDPGR